MGKTARCFPLFNRKLTAEQANADNPSQSVSFPHLSSILKITDTPITKSPWKDRVESVCNTSRDLSVFGHPDTAVV